MKKTWYLFRHALATYSTTGYGEQIVTASILPEAKPPIEKMAQYLAKVSESKNFSSEFLRCRQTTEIITNVTQKVFVTDKRLNEYYNETFQDFHSRVQDFVVKTQTFEDENLLLCTHGAVVSAIKTMLLKDEVTERDLLDYPACGELLIIKDKKVETIDFNKS